MTSSFQTPEDPCPLLWQHNITSHAWQFNGVGYHKPHSNVFYWRGTLGSPWLDLGEILVSLIEFVQHPVLLDRKWGRESHSHQWHIYSHLWSGSFLQMEKLRHFMFLLFSVYWLNFWDWTQFEVCNLLCVIMGREVGHNEWISCFCLRLRVWFLCRMSRCHIFVHVCLSIYVYISIHTFWNMHI